MTILIILGVLGFLFLLGVILVIIGFDLIDLVFGIIRIGVICLAIFGACALFL